MNVVLIVTIGTQDLQYERELAWEVDLPFFPREGDVILLRETSNPLHMYDVACSEYSVTERRAYCRRSELDCIDAEIFSNECRLYAEAGWVLFNDDFDKTEGDE